MARSSSSPSARPPHDPGVPSAPWQAARLVPEALRLLRRHRSLWPLALIPAALGVLLLGVAASVIAANAGLLMDWTSSWLPRFEAGAWYTWLWIGPLQLAMALARLLLFALGSGVLLLAAWLLAGLAAAPILDVLSARVERLEAGRVAELPGSQGLLGILREGGRAFRGELQRLSFFAGLWLLISVAGFVVPGGQLVAPPLLTVVTILFLPLEYAGYALDRRGLSFGEKRSWLRAHTAAMAGFGTTAFVCCLVPVLNLVMIPVLVTAGTLLVLRMPPPASRVQQQAGDPEASGVGPC